MDEGSRQTRVFVGGLGASVEESDLEKTFSMLGTVKGVEIIRTNGRSFAYMNFEPSSEKALGKLFSMYNGCVWKGGRLRLEKAKEHYLNRLKREWAEDAELQKEIDEEIDAGKEVPVSKVLKKAAYEKMQLRLFFPRLTKVKPLPYGGTGKHKYSFQRIEVPSLPVHFCDCEEHSCPPESAGKGVLSHKADQINEKELNIMNAVMNKLFDREKVEESERVLTVEEKSSNDAVDDLPFRGPEEDEPKEEENLVMNIMTEEDQRQHLMQTDVWKSIQDTDFVKHKPSNEGLATRTPRHEETRNVSALTPNKKSSKTAVRKHTSVFSEMGEEDAKETNDFISVKIDERIISTVLKKELDGSKHGPVGIKTKSSISKPREGLSWEQKSGEAGKSLATLSSDLKEPGGQTEVQRGILSESGTENNRSWTQKSSWKELVGGTGNSLFSLSEVLPSVKRKLSSEPMKSAECDQQNFMKYKKVESGAATSRVVGMGNPEVQGEKVFASSISKDTNVKVQKNEPALDAKQIGPEGTRRNVRESSVFTEPPHENSVEEPQKDAIIMGEVCTFMRSAASEREWMRAKVALSGSLKKKSKEKDASKGSMDRRKRTS